MIFLYGIAFISGLLTILAPCIWPILPIVLSSASSGGKRKPLGITLGIISSFGVFTLTISYIVKIIPFDPNILRLIAVLVIGFLGLSLIIPRLSEVFEGMVSRLSSKFGAVKNKTESGFSSGFITGLSLGVVWAPCAGPILATIATLAATRAVNFQIILLTLVYLLGVAIPLFIFTLAGSRLLNKAKFLNKHTGKIQQIFGVIMLLTALATYTNYDKVLQVKLLELFPSYSSFIYKLENNDKVSEELNRLRSDKKIDSSKLKLPLAKPGSLPKLGKAPEFQGVSKWLNTEPLTMAQLKGKVVLIDFWTYTCINCIRTLPFVTGWYEKYKDEGFVVVGVHTPEFEFEKNTLNVQNAIKQYNIHYPVAQDNDYSTWTAFSNRYWPAHYLIDAEGNIRHYHFGEGEYDKMEKAIQSLLKEAGIETTDDMLEVEEERVSGSVTAETYLGSSRMEYYYSSGRLNNGEQRLELDESVPLNTFSLGGVWTINDEYSTSVENSSIVYNFEAQKVFLVIHPPEGVVNATVKVYLDGKAIPNSLAGVDVKNGVAIITVPQLYKLVNLKKIENHTLKLQFDTPGTKVYAFTFG